MLGGGLFKCTRGRTVQGDVVLGAGVGEEVGGRVLDMLEFVEDVVG